MKALFFSIIALFTLQFAHSNSIVISPGDTIDVITEISSTFESGQFDTIAVDSGTNSVFLKAGASNDGTYSWNIDGNSSDYIINFNVNQATVVISESSNGFLIETTRTNPVVDRKFWLIYNNLPTKPTIPEGPKSVCKGTNSQYISSSQNSENYDWKIIPFEAGIINSDSIGSVLIAWNINFTGSVEIFVRGIKGEALSEFSDSLTVSVESAPDKPQIAGDNFVEINSSSIYKLISDNELALSWNVAPQNLCTFYVIKNELLLNFAKPGYLFLSAYSTNHCGNSEESEILTIRIVDINTLETKLDSLESENTLLIENIDQIKADSTLAGFKYRYIIDSLKQEKLICSDQLVLLSEYIHILNETINNLRDSITSLISEKKSLEIEFQKSLFQLNELLLLNQKLYLQVDSLQIVISELQDEIIVIGEQFEILEGVLGNTKAALAEVTQELEKYKNKVTDLENDNETLQDQILTLTAENNSFQSQISELERQLSILSQVYILQWEVKEITTKTFETEIGKFSISLYPNPSPGQIFIECSENMKQIEILNLQGEILKSFILNAKNTSFIVNRTEMPTGTYFVKIETDKGKSIHKMIFQ
jgi:hypothetical protein